MRAVLVSLTVLLSLSSLAKAAGNPNQVTIEGSLFIANSKQTESTAFAITVFNSKGDALVAGRTNTVLGSRSNSVPAGYALANAKGEFVLGDIPVTEDSIYYVSVYSMMNTVYAFQVTVKPGESIYLRLPVYDYRQKFSEPNAEELRAAASMDTKDLKLFVDTLVRTCKNEIPDDKKGELLLGAIKAGLRFSCL